MSIKKNITNAVIEGEASQVKSLVEVSLQMGLPQNEIIDSMLTGMKIISKEFSESRQCIPDVIISGRAIQAGLYVLETNIGKSNFELKPKIAIGTVAGDLHDIGKSLVTLALQGAGMEVIDLGVDISPEEFVEDIKKYKPDVLAMSALLSITKSMLKETIQVLENNNVRKGLKIIVGGGPVTQDYATEIGADGYASDAFDTIDLIKTLVN